MGELVRAAAEWGQGTQVVYQAYPSYVWKMLKQAVRKGSYVDRSRTIALWDRTGLHIATQPGGLRPLPGFSYSHIL